MPPASIPAFLLVAPHEEFVARVRPGELVKRLAVAWAPEFGIEGGAWKFEVLPHRRRRKQTSAAAAAADMTIISSSAAAELPSHLLNWFKSWLPYRRSGPAALAVLLEQKEKINAGQRPARHLSLRQMAEEAGLDFFCNAGDEPFGDPHERAQSPERRAEISPAKVGGVRSPPSSRDLGASRNETRSTATKRRQKHQLR